LASAARALRSGSLTQPATVREFLRGTAGFLFLLANDLQKQIIQLMRGEKPETLVAEMKRSYELRARL
jgi:hypothetical protein